MTSRPGLATDGNWLAGVVAVGLFGVLSAVFLTAGIDPANQAGFEGGTSIVAGIGYAMFNMMGMLDGTGLESEGFLIAFETIDVVLVAALVAAVMLARRDDDDGTAARADGGQPPTGDRGGGE